MLIGQFGYNLETLSIRGFHLLMAGLAVGTALLLGYWVPNCPSGLAIVDVDECGLFKGDIATAK